MQNPHDGHRQRIRNRIIAEGASSLEPHELIEYLLYFTIPRRNINPLAHALLDRFSSLEALFAADPADLQCVEGISAASAQWLHTVGQAVFAYMQSADPPIRLRTRGDARIFLQEFFQMKSGSWLFCLNVAGCITQTAALDAGTPWFSPENRKNIVSNAVTGHAAYIILAESRPRADISGTDARHARELAEALGCMQITLLSLAAVGEDGSYLSLDDLTSLTAQPADSLAETWALT